MSKIWSMVFWAAVIIGWIIYSIVGSMQTKRRNQPKSQTPPKKPGRNRNLLSSKATWAWMQTAGFFGLKFVRPEVSGGPCPSISGTVDGIRVVIHALPKNELTGGGRSTVLQFYFPHSAGIKLNLMLIRDSEQLRRQTAGRQSRAISEIMKAELLSNYFFQTDSPEIFRECCPAECLNQLIRLSQSYPAVMLTDNALLVHLSGFPDDAQGFRIRLGTLLDIARDLGFFAERTAERRKKRQNGTAQKPMQTVQQDEAKPEPQQQTEPAPAPAPVPEPPKAIAIPDESAPAGGQPPFPEPADQSAFIRALWSGNRNSGELREIFAPYIGTEVEWQGKLKTHFRFSSDPFSGGKPGVKAAFELEEFKPEGSFLPIRVKTVVFFPPETEPEFDRGTGKTFRFRGRFLKIEPIAKEICLAGESIAQQEGSAS